MWNNLSNNINEVVSHYNPKYKLYESIMIQINDWINQHGGGEKKSPVQKKSK